MVRVPRSFAGSLSEDFCSPTEALRSASSLREIFLPINRLGDAALESISLTLAISPRALQRRPYRIPDDCAFAWFGGQDR